MTRKCSCSRSTFLSCLSYFSARDTGNAPASSATANTNVETTSASSATFPKATTAETGAGLHDTRPPPLNPDASTSQDPAEKPSFSEVPAIVKQDGLRSGGSSSSSTLQTVSDHGDNIRKDPAIVKQDGPRSGGSSSSSTLQTVSSHVENILKDVAAVEEGDNVNVDLDGLINHISQLLQHIKFKDHGKKESLPKLLHRYLPSSKSFSKLKEFISDATNFVKDIIPGDTKTIVRDLLHGMGTAHLATTGLLVVANILERFEHVSNNKEECFNVLKEMLFLAKVVKQIQERSQLQEGMQDEVKDATELIVEGSIKCCSQMDSSQFSKFFSSSVNKKQLSELAQQLDAKYKHIYIQMGIQIYDASQYKQANLSRHYDEKAVGIQRGVKEVTELLEWESEQKVVSVILHGIGGMGKTTLADAVFALVNIRGCQYSMVQFSENMDSQKIMDLQKSILKDLTGSANIAEIRKPENGQRELSRVLEGVIAFIYIDNALGERELGQLLPQDMSTAKRVRLLITTRDLNVRKACPLKTHPKEYRMGGISSVEATNLLKMDICDDVERILHSYKVNHIIKKCGGIPLMLKLVAGALRDAKDLEEVDQVLDELEKLKGDDFGSDKIEPYFFAYEKLPTECKEPFLDICSFFEGWDWDIVANIMGKSELGMLARRALVTEHTSGVVSVHDVILTLGRRKSNGMRFTFTGASELKKFLDGKEEKDLHNIKGIWLNEDRDLFPLSATILDSMHRSLRILKLGNLTKIEGKCYKVFENLIFFQGAVRYLPFDTRELKYLSYQPKDLKLSEIPRSLRHMEFDGRLHSDAFEISSTELKEFQNLRVMRLTRFAKLKKLGDLVKDLRELTLSYCQSIEELPSSISMLQFLRVLRMDYCLKLKSLPEDIGSLNSLQELNLQGCTSLKELPNSFEKLSLLKSLDLSSCKMLLQLPEGIGSLTSLVNFSFNECSSLTSIPQSIGGLKSSAFSMDMSYCSSLKELPDTFAELRNLRELNLCECRSLKKLPKSFGQLKCLIKLNLSKCISLETLCDEFHCLSSLEILDLSRCESLKELPQDFHCLTSLINLYLSGCKTLRELPQNFHCLPSLQHLYLCHCNIWLQEKCMDTIVKMKTLQIVNIEGSSSLVTRWEQIQRRDHQSWSSAVFTGKDLSKEEKENMLQKLLSELHHLLINKQGGPFHLRYLPQNTLSLVMFHSDPNDDFPCPLIEETVDDIQINFNMIYVGRHYHLLPQKVKDGILGYSDEVSKIQLMVVKLLLTLDVDARESWLSTLEKNVRESWLERYNAEEPVCFTVEMIGDGENGKYHSRWKVLSKFEMEELVLSKSGRYLKLKQIVETSQKSNIVLLRELFATQGKESNPIFQRNCASNKDPTENSQPFVCGVDKLEGKTILLEMRSVNDLCNDIGHRSMSEMYLREKERLDLEIISVPIVQRSTTFDVHEQFSGKVSWLVLRYQWTWTITRAVKYFLVKHWCPERDNKWSPSIFWIIEPNGKISFCNPYHVLLMLNNWGSKASSFTYEKFEEDLRQREWTQWKNMSNLEFLFSHLKSTIADQVKGVMFQEKVICLYGGKEDEKVTRAIRNALINWRDNIHIIYIPQFDSASTETLNLTDNIYKDYHVLKTSFEVLPLEMYGISVLNLSEHLSKHEILRFWMRLFYLNEESHGIDRNEMNRLIHSFQFTDEDKGLDFLNKKDILDTGYGCLTFMDKDGKMVAACRGKNMGWIFKNKNRAKRLMQSLVKVLRKEEIQKNDTSNVSDLTENIMKTADAAVDQENVDVNSLSEYTTELLGMEQLYQLLKFNKERGKSPRPYATRHYWPTSRGFSMLKNFLSDGTNANWVKDFISSHPEEDEDHRGNIISPHPKEEEGDPGSITCQHNEEDMLKGVIESLLEGIGEAQWAAAGLLMIADILERLETLYANRNEHLMLLVLLDEMYRSTKEIKQMKDEMKKTKDEMKNLMVCILMSALSCCTGNNHSDLIARLSQTFGLRLSDVQLQLPEVNGLWFSIYCKLKKLCDPAPRIFRLPRNFFLECVKSVSFVKGGKR